MKALVLEEYGRFEFKDVPEPVVGPEDVLIRVKVCAVCGSDVHGMDGSTGRRLPPIIMGHEASGVIEKLGASVTGYRVGDRVTFDSTIYCGGCKNCHAGLVNLCGQRRVLGVSCQEYRMHGAFAELVAVPARVLYALPDGVDFLEASMVEPLSVAYHGVTRARIVPGCTAVVVGVGTIGMLIVQVLKALGAGKVIALDINEDKLKFALAHGADHAINSKDSGALAQLQALTEDGEGADVAYDATGVPATVEMTIQSVKKGGSCVLVGNVTPNVNLPLQHVVTRELTLLGSCTSAGEYPECLRLIAEHKVDVRSLISRGVPLAEGDEWIQRVRAGEPGLSKIALIPEA